MISGDTFITMALFVDKEKTMLIVVCACGGCAIVARSLHNMSATPIAIGDVPEVLEDLKFLDRPRGVNVTHLNSDREVVPIFTGD